jgi:glycosyltransferase involved in cell wall biosynthesis
MRILFLTGEQFLPAVDSDGVGSQKLVEAMADAGHEVTVCAPIRLGAEEIGQIEARHGVRLVPTFSFQADLGLRGGLPSRLAGSVLFALKLAKVLVGGRFDAVFVVNCPPATPALLFRRLVGGIYAMHITRFVAGLGGSARSGAGKAVLEYERRVICRFDLVFANTYQMKTHLLLSGCAPSKVKVFWGGYDEGMFTPGAVPEEESSWIRREAGLERRIVFFDGFVDGDVLPRLREVMSRVIAARDDVTFVVSGGGGGYGVLKSEFPPEKAVFPGEVARARLPAYLAAADVVAVIQEESANRGVTLPPGTLESLAMGRPAAVWKTECVPEMLDVYDSVKACAGVDEMAAAILELLDFPKIDASPEAISLVYGWGKVSQDIVKALETKAKSGY